MIKRMVAMVMMIMVIMVVEVFGLRLALRPIRGSLVTVEELERQKEES